jgi:hypothetical protein
METIHAVTSTPDGKTDAYSPINAALRAHQAVASAGEARLTYITRFKAKTILNGENRVAKRLVYTRCFDTIATDRGGNVVDGLLSALVDKRLKVGFTATAKAQATGGKQREAAPSPLPARHTKKPRPTRRDDGVTRRAHSCTPYSNYMRHRVRRECQAWKDIGASGQVLKWIREGVAIPFLNNRPPPPVNQGYPRPTKLTFVEAELARFVETGVWEPAT